MALTKTENFKERFDSRDVVEQHENSRYSEKPVYLLEHLATFTVNEEAGILTPSDGMKRLLQLEKTTGIWSQKMQLCLDNNWITIIDFDSKNIIEKFPVSFVQVPTAFTSNSPMEIYNNILVFIVDGDGNDPRAEMHIFQSQNTPAGILAEDLKQLSGSKGNIRETNKKTSNYYKDKNAIPFNESDSEFGNQDETSSTSSDKYEKDVIVLNHCFDDIEKFIARLQHTAIVAREMEKRNKKSKKKNSRDELMRNPKAPYEKEFIDIFAKFKLSINLLGKLKSHIHDPSAFELIHFLFTPLVLIVEASNDTYYNAHLPSHVIAPLFTQDAIRLMDNCLSIKEKDVWRSLGEAWLIPKDQWKGYTNNYHPVFFDGWSPDYPVVDNLEEHLVVNTNTRRKNIVEPYLQMKHDEVNLPKTQYRNQSFEMKREFDQNFKFSHNNSNLDKKRSSEESRNFVNEDSRNQNVNLRSNTSFDSPAEEEEKLVDSRNRVQSLINGITSLNTNDQRSDEYNSRQDINQWLTHLQLSDANVVQVTYPRTANNEKELTVLRGEILEVLDDNRKWWKVKNTLGQVGHVPHTIVTPYDFENENDLTDHSVNNAPPNVSNTKYIGKKGEFRYF